MSRNHFSFFAFSDDGGYQDLDRSPESKRGNNNNNGKKMITHLLKKTNFSLHGRLNATKG